jgi:NTP pyrophosphatase (non-canonical NTP hydrolase)
VGGFSDEHNAGIGETVEEQGEFIRPLRRWKRLAMMTENLGDLAADRLATAFKRG